MAVDTGQPMGRGGPMDEARYSAPRFQLIVEDNFIPIGITQFIESVEYESTESAVDMIKLEALDPEKKISNLKIFLPGNELKLWIGYGASGSDLVHIGNAVIVNTRATFPAEGQPSIEVTGYTRDHFMMEVRPDPDPPPNVKSKSTKKKDTKFNYNGIPVGAVISGVAGAWKMTPDVDDVKLPKGNLLQPIKMSDYDFIRGLANIVGYYFWVDADEDGKWYLHFKDPSKLLKEQKKQYRFKYCQGESSTLLNFEPEMVFKNHFTKIQAQTKLPNGKMLKVAVVEGKVHEWSTKPMEATEESEDEIKTAQEIQLFIGEYSFKAIHAGQFKDAAALEVWAQQWFKRHQQDFVIGSGSVIGLETLRARQIHRFEGLGTLYDGSWNFVKVRHVFDVSSGYTCEVAARKVV